MRWKRTAALLLTACLALSLSCAWAGTLVGYVNIDGVRRGILKDGDWWYYQTDDGMVIYQYSGKSKDIVIPETLDGVPVVSATTWAMPTGVTSVVIPGSFAAIPDRMLYNRTSLTSVTLCDGVQSTGASLCWNCLRLTDLSLPASLKTIDTGAFYGCKALTEFTIPNGVQTVASDTFWGCTALKSVRFPSALRRIKANAFHGCTALLSVQIPAGTSVADSAFPPQTSIVRI